MFDRGFCSMWPIHPHLFFLDIIIYSIRFCLISSKVLYLKWFLATWYRERYVCVCLPCLCSMFRTHRTGIILTLILNNVSYCERRELRISRLVTRCGRPVWFWWCRTLYRYQSLFTILIDHAAKEDNIVNICQDFLLKPGWILLLIVHSHNHRLFYYDLLKPVFSASLATRHSISSAYSCM